MSSLIRAVAIVAFSLTMLSLRSASPQDGLIFIQSYSGWVLTITADGSAGLIYGSGLPNAAQIPKGTYDFNLLSRLLLSQFGTVAPSEREQKFCFVITVEPPHQKKSADDIQGRSCDRKLLDPLFERALRVGKPNAPEAFKKALEYYPIVAK